MKALVVEEDLKSQCLLAKVLAERAHEATTFENAEQAILEYEKEFYPLLFVDVRLPGMDGLQYCRWIRSQPRGGETYVIAAVDPEAPNEVREALEAGANDFLTKPYQLDHLRARLAIGERQMSQFFEQQQLEQNLRSETQRWTSTERALISMQQEFEVALNAKEAELGQVRDELRALEQNRGLEASLESAVLKKDEDLDRLREEIGGLWDRCTQLERTLEESRQECAAGQARVDEAEKALEAARAETARLRQLQGDAAESAREALRNREEELSRFKRELVEAREALRNGLRGHTEELVRLSDQMRQSLDDRKKLEHELAAAQAELVRRGPGHASMLEELKVHRDARKRHDSRWRALVRFGTQLNRAGTSEEVAGVAGRATHELAGWDLFSLDACVAEGDWIHPLLSLECVQGESRQVEPIHSGAQPTSLMRRVLEDGPQIILRPASAGSRSGVMTVDDRTRRSVSLVCVPLILRGRVTGFLTLRSGGEQAYGAEDLETLEMVAAQCAGALERIELVTERSDHGIAESRLAAALAVPALP